MERNLNLNEFETIGSVQVSWCDDVDIGSSKTKFFGETEEESTRYETSCEDDRTSREIEEREESESVEGERGTYKTRRC